MIWFYAIGAIIVGVLGGIFLPCEVLILIVFVMWIVDKWVFN
jgi:hypothetical protein